ncbi:MAG TPA: hypothetical protein VNA89_07310 [Gemmatimonadaceae bacterium]|nr:hypothetical protein [Gemmatimonadaceae bacterium]
MSTHLRQRRGFALLIALGVIIVIGGLMAGAFLSSTNEYRAGRGTLETERALAVAEGGHAQLLSNWNLLWNGQIRNNGQTLPVQNYTVGGYPVSVRVTRLNDMSIYAVAEANLNPASPQLNAYRRTGMLLKLNVPRLPFQGAITGAGPTAATGNGAVSGFDVNPPSYSGGDCDAPGAAKAGLVGDNMTEMTSAGTCGSFSCITGTPQRVADPAAGQPSYYEEFGDYDFADMKTEAVAAGKVFDATLSPIIAQVKPSYNADGTCNTNDVKNWGDQNHTDAFTACDNYYPTIYIKGIPAQLVTINQGAGQGVLISEASLKFAGQFAFTGPVIIKGNVAFEGNGNKLWGGVMAANEGCITSPCNTVKGDSQVSFSSCAITMALASRPVYPVVARRSWVDLF